MRIIAWIVGASGVVVGIPAAFLFLVAISLIEWSFEIAAKARAAKPDKSTPEQRLADIDLAGFAQQRTEGNRYGQN